MNDPKYASPYPAQGHNQGPPVTVPPQYPNYSAPRSAPNYSAPRPPQNSSRFIEGCIATMCFCCLLDGCTCCCDPSLLFMG